MPRSASTRRGSPLRRRPRAIARYRLVQDGLMNRIEKGEYAPGDRIPTEKEIARIYGVSVGTVKTALLQLVHQGLLHRIQGKGSFVSGSLIGREQLRLYHFVQGFDDEDAPLQVKFLGLQRGERNAEAARWLRLKPGQPLFRVDRLFAMGATPVVLTSSFLPGRLFAGFEELPREELETRPLYRLVEERYRLPTLRYREMFSAVLADGESASRLGVPPGFPLLRIEMLALSFRDRPIEYRLSLCRTDRARLFRLPLRAMASA
ncbi:MAG: GntR family transcriptional regulator [Desulfobacterales bacterium]